jgi:hypothetical protein
MNHVAVAFCLENVQSFRDFPRQIMPSYFCTIPNRLCGIIKVKMPALTPLRETILSGMVRNLQITQSYMHFFEIDCPTRKSDF